MPAAPVTNPLGLPSVSGTGLTVDYLLNNPTRITRDVARLANARFFADQLFTTGGPVSGGAVLYEVPVATATDLYAERDVQEVAPGAEFPILTFQRGAPMVAGVRKFGGKFAVTDEAKDRNDARVIQRAMLQTANTIARKVDQVALAVLDAAVTTYSRNATVGSWSDAVALTNDTKTAGNVPISDLVTAANTIDLEERGHTLNGIVLHPNQNADLIRLYGASGVDAALASVGITKKIVSPRMTAGSAYLFEQGQVGFWRNESPLSQRVFPDPHGIEQQWYQWAIRFVMGIDDPYTFLRIDGLAA